MENKATIIRWAMAVLMVDRLTGRDLRLMFRVIQDAESYSVRAVS